MSKEHTQAARQETAGSGDFTLDATADVSAVIETKLSGVEEVAAPFSVGQLLNGRYAVEQVIGRGGMGWVYAVRDGAQSGRLIALKTLPGFAKNAARRSMFKAEFSTMAKLEHPNVARVYDFEELKGKNDLFITMELVDGAPIHRAVRAGRALPDTLDTVVQVCRALSYMHSRRIVHFDLKPANILLDAHNVVKVVDFGISGAEPITSGGRALGTIPYMAPELLFGGATADYRADLYSLGITLYELSFGDLPCPTNNLQKLSAWFKAGGVRAPADAKTPAWLGRIIEKLCALEPADRFRHANAVIEAIGAGAGRTYDIETEETRQSYIATPSFTGRGEELDRILLFIGERLSGRGSEPALFVRGISGIGKSRLFLEARRETQLRSRLFFEANCYERSLVEYGPIADLLHQLVPIVETLGGLEIVQRALPELVKIAPRLAEGRQFTPAGRAATAEGERVRLLEATSEFFVEASRLAPYAIYLNDLQWAGRGPAQIIAHLAMRVRDDQESGHPVRIAILGSYRSDEVEGRPLADVVKTLESHALAIELELQPLGEREVARVACSMLGVDAVPEEFLSRLARETSGNPFFVQEVMRVLFENQTVYLLDGRWAARNEIGELSIPASMADVFRRRFALLGDSIKDVVRALAVHGRPIRFELLVDVLGSSSDVFEALRELEERSIAVRLDDKNVSYNIAHDRMRETIYDDLADDERKSWHRRIAERLESTSADQPDEQKPLDEIALHYWHAAVDEKAREYAILAGRRALVQFSNEAALQHLEHALHLLGREDGRYREIAEAHADSLARMLRYDDAIAGYEELIHALSDRQDKARMHGKIADIHVQRTELEQAVERGWQAAELLGETRPRGAFGWIWATLSGFSIFLLIKLGVRSLARPLPHAAERVAAHDAAFHAYFFLNPLCTFHCALRAWRIGRGSGDVETDSCGHALLGIMLGIAGMRAWSYEILDRGIADAERVGSTFWVGVGLKQRAMIERMDGEWRPEGIARSVELLARCGDLFELGAAQYHAAEIALFAGDVREAQEMSASYNASAFRAAEAPMVAKSTLAHEALCRSYRGEAGSEALFERALELATVGRDFLMASLILLRWGQSSIMEGRLGEGIAKLEQSYEMRVEKRLLDNYTAEILFRLPRAYLCLPSLDKRREAIVKKLHAQALAQTKKMHRNWRSPTLVNAALLEERAGNARKADAFFAEALRVAQDQHAELFAGEALYEWGRVLVGRDADPRERLSGALEIAERTGNRWLAARCTELLEERAVA